MPVVMEAVGLSRQYAVNTNRHSPSANVCALDNVSFSLAKGRTLAIVGESGSGKSTLARLLTGVELPNAGRLYVEGDDVAALKSAERRAMGKKVQMVFQNPQTSLNPRKTVAAALEEPLRIHRACSAGEMQDRVHRMLRAVGLDKNHAPRYPHMLSGGQRQRVAIARAMILNPRVVVADEPTSALDVSVQAQILNLFADLQNQFNTAFVFISHNLSVVRHIADDILVMSLGRVIEYGPSAEILAAPRHPYTQALLSATPQLGGIKRQRVLLKGELPSPLKPPPGCAFSSRCPHVRQFCREERPRLEWHGRHAVACPYPLPK